VLFVIDATSLDYFMTLKKLNRFTDRSELDLARLDSTSTREYALIAQATDGSADETLQCRQLKSRLLPHSRIVQA